MTYFDTLPVAYDCYVNNEVYDSSKIVNSFVDTKLTKSTGKLIVYNSYVKQTSQRSGATMILSNCVYLTGGTAVADAETSTLVTEAPHIDLATRRPIRGKSDLLIDTGVAADHVYPSAFASELGKDVTGGQRIYNQKIDIGCGEYDWRGDFTAQLGAKGVAVEAASANVTTNDLNGLVLFDGDALKLKLTTKTDGKASLKAVVAGVATLSVKVGETEVPGDDGLYAFDVSAGETVVEVSLSGTGTATLSDVTIPKTGMMLLLR